MSIDRGGLYLVTVKLPKNPAHNPRNKVVARCPIAETGALCTDSTGEHHTLVIYGASITSVTDYARELYGHVTRVETCTIHYPIQTEDKTDDTHA